MTRISLAACLMLLVALNDVYETQGTFSLPLYLKNFPKMDNDLEPFAYKGMLDFVDGLESKCPRTAEFKDFFAKLEEFMACFKSASPGSIDIDVEMSRKSQKIFKAMSTLDGTKGGTSVDSWRMIDGLLSMGKVLVEMKKHVSKEITFEQRKEVISGMVKWARAVGLFVKMASEKKGKSVDLASFGIDYENNVPPSSKRTLHETKETFSLPLYLKNFPKMSNEFEPFAYKGMLEFVGDLEGKCPATPEFKEFFAKLKDYMACFKSESRLSKDIQIEMSLKSDSLFKAISALNGTKGGALEDSWRLVDGLLSMGQSLAEMNSGSKEINFEQRKELFSGMVKWTRAIGLFVKTASENKGQSIDLASFGIDYDNHGSTPSNESGNKTEF